MHKEGSISVKPIVFNADSNYLILMSKIFEIPFFLSIPHSGEQVPEEVTWLQGLSEPVLMRDVDRYVDTLYKPVIEKQKIPSVVSPWHRYVVDLNRKTDQYDLDAVVGADKPSGTEPKGLHWSITTQNEKLIQQPMTQDLHEQLVTRYYRPFHDSVQEMRSKIFNSFGKVFHLDLHSMPSLGTDLHPDPGQSRAEVVVSDCIGTSASSEFKDLVMEAYQVAGFQVAYNWPYVGGGITRTYGEPKKQFHTIQVELNRALYMDEISKQIKEGGLLEVQKKLETAIVFVQNGLKECLDG